MADFATSYATLSLCFTSTEWREVIMEEELHVVLLQSTIDHLLIKLGTEGTSRERLSLTTCEDRRSVWHWEWRNLTPDRANLIGLTAIETYAFVENTATHSVLLYVMIIFIYESILLFHLILSEVSVSCSVCLFEFFLDSIESFSTSLLFESLLYYVVALLVAFLSHLFLEFIIVYLMAILALSVCAELLHEFVLHSTHRLDSCMSCFESVEEVRLLHFLHLSLHHHDVLLSSTYHKVHISFLHLFECRVDDKLTIDACNTHLRDRAFEWDVRASQSTTCSKSCKSIRLIYTVSGEKDYVNINLSVEIAWEKWAESAVNKAACEDFLIACLTFTLCETAWEAACSGILLTILYLQWHEICSRNCILCGTNSSEEHGVTHLEGTRAVSLLSQLTGLNGDFTSIRQ